MIQAHSMWEKGNITHFQEQKLFVAVDIVCVMRQLIIVFE